MQSAKIASPPVFCTQWGSALYLVSHRKTISTNIHLFRPVFTIQGYIPNPRGQDLSSSMLQISRVFPCVSCLRNAKAIQCPCPGPNIGDKGQQIPGYSSIDSTNPAPFPRWLNVHHMVIKVFRSVFTTVMFKCTIITLLDDSNLDAFKLSDQGWISFVW